MKHKLFAKARQCYKQAHHFFRLAAEHQANGSAWWAWPLMLEAMELENKGDELHAQACRLHLESL